MYTEVNIVLNDDKTESQIFQFFEIVVDPRCVEFIKDIEKYTWDEIDGKKIAKPKDGDDLYIQEMFYALNDVMEQVKPLQRSYKNLEDE